MIPTPVNSRGITGISGKKNFTVISVEKTLMTIERDFLER